MNIRIGTKNIVCLSHESTESNTNVLFAMQFSSYTRPLNTQKMANNKTEKNTNGLIIYMKNSKHAQRENICDILPDYIKLNPRSI